MKFHCPHCTQKLQINDRLAGKTVRCPNCNHRLTVPASAAPERKAAAGARQTRQSKSISVRRQPAGKGTPKPAAMPKSAAKESAAAPPPPSPSLPPTSAPPMPGKRADSTNVSLLVSLGIGVALAVGFYAGLFPFSGAYLNELFTRRGWVPYVLVGLMGWAVGILILKGRKLQRQRHALLLDVLPTEIADDITVENVTDFLGHVWSLPAKLHESFMVNRMRRGLEHFQVRRSNPEVASMMMSQSEIDAGSVHSSYTLLKVFIWAIPILGFIGTVLGISKAVGGFSDSLASAQTIDVLKESLNTVTLGLAEAFDTTLIALVMSLLVSFPASATQKSEEDMLTAVYEYSNENLLKRINDAGGLSDVAHHTEAIMGSLGSAVAGSQEEILKDFRAVQDRMAELQGEQKKVLEGMAGAVDTQLKSMEQRASDHQKKVEDNLGKMVAPVDKAMTGLTERTEHTQKRVLDDMQKTSEAMQGYCKTLTSGMESLNRVLAELGEKQIVIRKERRPLFGFIGRKDRDDG